MLLTSLDMPHASAPFHTHQPTAAARTAQALLDDYACALKKRMLLQGRAYVFEEHLCFQCVWGVVVAAHWRGQ